MNARSIGAASVAVFAFGCGRPAAPPASVPREKVELTIYKDDFAMVSEVRPVTLRKGANRLRVPQVSRQIDAQSVILRWSRGGLAGPVSHSFDLGVANAGAMLQRYVGQEVELVTYGQAGTEGTRRKGVLVTAADGQVVLQSEGKFYINPPGTVVADDDGSAPTVPQLIVSAASPANRQARLDVAYLTRGFSWSADYTATLHRAASTIDLDGWASVTNRTGADYPSAKVSLAAGEPNRAAVSERAKVARLRSSLVQDFDERVPASLAGTTLAQPEAVAGMYVYPVRGLTDVAQERVNRLSFLSTHDVPVNLDLSARLPTLWAWELSYGDSTSGPKRVPVNMAINFRNLKGVGLGLPLPAGAVRAYQADQGGSLRYVGAAGLPDTPKDRRIDLTLGVAFDLQVETRVLKWRKIDRRTAEADVQVDVTNSSGAPAKVRVVQTFVGRGAITQETIKHSSLNASRAQWLVNVSAGATVPLKYTLRLPR